MSYIHFSFDKKLCIKCGSCMSACSQKHGKRQIINSDNEGYPTFCRHCKNAPVFLFARQGQ
jgi:Fe-S-cluster-containing hydrogenase component 2